MLYRCLVGRSPFTGTTTQILYAHVYDPVTIPDDILRTLSPILVEILRKTLAKDPAARYASAEQMADDLLIAAGRPLSIIDAIDPADSKMCIRDSLRRGQRNTHVQLVGEPARRRHQR